ncbi:hypothetical protein MTO96_000116 [Rhipicephalus appendiculatus]
MGRRVPTLTTRRCLLDLALADAASCRRCTDGFGVGGGDPLLELVCSCRRRRRCRRDCRRRRPSVDAGTRAPGGRLFPPSRGGEQPPPPPASSDSPGRASSSAPPFRSSRSPVRHTSAPPPRVAPVGSRGRKGVPVLAQPALLTQRTPAPPMGRSGLGHHYLCHRDNGALWVADGDLTLANGRSSPIPAKDNNIEVYKTKFSLFPLCYLRLFYPTKLFAPREASFVHV